MFANPREFFGEPMSDEERRRVARRPIERPLRVKDFDAATTTLVQQLVASGVEPMTPIDIRRYIQKYVMIPIGDRVGLDISREDYINILLFGMIIDEWGYNHSQGKQHPMAWFCRYINEWLGGYYSVATDVIQLFLDPSDEVLDVIRKSIVIWIENFNSNKRNDLFMFLYSPKIKAPVLLMMLEEQRRTLGVGGGLFEYKREGDRRFRVYPDEVFREEEMGDSVIDISPTERGESEEAIEAAHREEEQRQRRLAELLGRPVTGLSDVEYILVDALLALLAGDTTQRTVLVHNYGSQHAVIVAVERLLNRLGHQYKSGERKRYGATPTIIAQTKFFVLERDAPELFTLITGIKEK